MALDKDFLLVLKSSMLGEGPTDLGELLTEKFLTTLYDSGKIPARIICMNSGIFLTTEGSSANDILKKFESGGTEVFSCSTCLEYYGRMDKLVVGKPSNMKDTVAAMTSFKQVISL